MKTLFPSKKIAIGYGLLFLLALVLRFYQLNIPMLSEQEASLALQAAGMPAAAPASMSGLAAVIAPILFLFGKSETTARVIPAVFGLLIIFTPFLFRKYLGDKAAVILSILLMFDPSIAAYSRQVNGVMLSLTGLLFAVGFLLNRRYIGAGIAAGFALLGSPSFWPGLLAIGLAGWLTYRKAGSVDELDDQGFPGLEQDDLIKAGIALLGTILLLGSVFMTRPAGMAAPIIQLWSYLQGWAGGISADASLMVMSLLLYQPVVLFMGITESILEIRSGDRKGKFLLWWFFLALMLSVAYPSRGFDSMVFVFLPLLVLSARCIIRIIERSEKPDMVAFGQMTLTILLLLFSWMNFIVVKFPLDNQEATLHMLAAAGGLLLLMIATILIRMGWPSIQCWTGLWMGLAVVFGIYAISTAWRSAGLGKNPETEVWNYQGITSEMDLLTKTAGDISEFNVSSRTGINIVALNYPSNALKWALRDFTSVNDATSLPSLSNPAIVITAGEEVPSLAKAYRGQDFALTRRTSWSLILPEEWIKWIAWREVPSNSDQIILWARADLFPGAEKNAPATISPAE